MPVVKYKCSKQDMKREVCGEFPEFCYKAFECEDYAKQFIYSGTFRLNCLGYCRNMENESRRDPTEGSGCTKELGIVTYYGFNPQNLKERPAVMRKLGYQEHQAQYGNKVYCFCACLPEVDRTHIERFGKYIVKINDPRKLAEDINDYFIGNGQKFHIVGCKVVYNKGQKLSRRLADNERFDLSCKQKPESFSPDCEFRIIAMKLGEVCEGGCKFLDVDGQSEPECKFIKVNLNKPLDYLNFD